jgi:hypothetical protein
MPNDDADQFTQLFAEIMSAQPEVVTTEVADEPQVVAPLAESRETLIANLVAEPVAAAEATKADWKEYRTVEKSEIEGGPDGSVSKVYVGLGYLSLTFNQGWRFQNRVCFYLDQLKAFVAFCRSPECDAWLVRLEAAGFRNRGESRKEG